MDTKLEASLSLLPEESVPTGPSSQLMVFYQKPQLVSAPKVPKFYGFT